jgi:ABC-type spermidine/putrescine transport system permease subunit I
MSLIVSVVIVVLAYSVAYYLALSGRSGSTSCFSS